jgi:hypothetical protein
MGDSIFLWYIAPENDIADLLKVCLLASCIILAPHLSLQVVGVYEGGAWY